jgi:hypothetical protein
MEELEQTLSLGHSGTGAPLYLLEPIIQILSDTLTGTEKEVRAAQMRRLAIAEGANGIVSVLNTALATGAESAEFCVPTPPWNGRVNIDAAVSERAATRIRAALDALPQGFRRAIGRVDIDVVQGTVRFQRHRLHGVMEYGQRRATVGVGPEILSRQVLRHELSHAFDYYAAGTELTGETILSNSARFQAAFARDLETFGTRHYDQFLAYYATSPAEAFAQSGAHLLGTMHLSEHFAQAFSNSIGVVREFFAEYGVAIAP